MSVARPMNRPDRDMKVEEKLRIWGIFQAFKSGKLPNNKQVDIALNSAIESEFLNNPRASLSSNGKLLLKDTRDVLEQLKRVFLQKNHEQSLQKFILLTSQASGPKADGLPQGNKQDANNALDGVKTIGRLLLSNGQFRKLLSDSVTILKEMGADTVEKTAQRLQPTEEEKQNVDQDAPEGEFKELPSLDELKQNAKDKSGFNNAQEAKEDTAAAAERARETGGDTDAARAELAERGHSEGVEKGDQKARQVREFVQDKVPEERRNAVIRKMRKTIAEVQSNTDYQQAIDRLMDIASKHSARTTQAARTRARSNVEQTPVTQATNELKKLLEYFADSTSLDDLQDSIDQLYRDADQDAELRHWWQDVEDYLKRCLKEKEYILKDESTDEYYRLRDIGKEFMHGKYKPHFDRVQDEAKTWFTALSEDPQNVKLGDSVKKLVQDLGTDTNGQITFKQHLVKDIVSSIIPDLLVRLRYVPLPRIEVSDPTVDVALENLMVEMENILPKSIEVRTDNTFRFSMFDDFPRKNHHVVYLHMSRIQCDLKDVSYYVHKKSGFPSISDNGVADIRISGTGLSADLTLSMIQDTKKDRKTFFNVDSIKVQVNNLDVQLKKSHHKTLYAILKPTLLGVMKPAIAKVAERQIVQHFRDLDAEAYSMKTDVDRQYDATVEDLEDGEQAPSKIGMYLSAVQKRIAQMQEEKSQKQSNTRTNFATTQDAYMFKSVHLQTGITKRAQEIKENAGKGQGWESPVFEIGSAKESADLPEPQPIQRPSEKGQKRSTNGNYANSDHEVQV